jgi:very-short-patch-repair endonuclease
VGNEYTVLGDYKTSKTKILMRHNSCGNDYMVTPNIFLTGHRCPHCFGSHKKTTRQFKQEVFDLVGNEYTVLGEYKNTNTRIKVRHNKCGNVYYVIPTNFLYGGTRCFNCSYNHRTGLTLDDFKNDVYNLVGDEYTVVGNTYKNNKTPIAIRHNKCGHINLVRPNDFKTGQSRCPFCHESKGEVAVEKSLKSHLVNFVKQKKFDNCINPKTGRKLPFDFYLPDYKVCIEFDGKQHYSPVDLFGGQEGFKKRQYLDNIKNRYCYDHNIRLIRISYKNYDDVENIIKTLQLYVYYLMDLRKNNWILD